MKLTVRQKQLIKEYAKRLIESGINFTEADIIPGLKYRYYYWPGKWATATVTKVVGNKVYTDENEPESIKTVFKKIQLGLKSTGYPGAKLAYYKLIPGK